MIREEASLLVAELRKDIAYSKVQFSIAQVYTSVGIDVTHLESNSAAETNARPPLVIPSELHWITKAHPTQRKTSMLQETAGLH